MIVRSLDMVIMKSVKIWSPHKRLFAIFFPNRTSLININAILILKCVPPCIPHTFYFGT